MAKDFKEADGNFERWLDCPGPECDFSGWIYYNTQPPEYCCNACKQRAYRRRKQKKRNTQGVTLLLRDLKDDYGFTGKLLSKIKDIAREHGPSAAQMATDAVLLAMKEERERRNQ